MELGMKIQHAKLGSILGVQPVGASGAKPLATLVGKNL